MFIILCLWEKSNSTFSRMSLSLHSPQSHCDPQLQMKDNLESIKTCKWIGGGTVRKHVAIGKSTEQNMQAFCICGFARGVYLFRKPNFQLYHILALLIFSCHPLGQECEFSVVRIKIAPFSCENCVLGQNLHFKGSVWLWRRRKHIVLIRRHCALSNISG